MTTLTRRAPVSAPDQSEFVGDRLDGAKAIATYFFGSDSTENLRRVNRLIKQKEIPFGKLGGGLIGSKRALDQHYRRLTGIGEAAD